MSTQATTQSALSGSVTSADGTRIGYRSEGAGPGMIIVPGALSTAADFATLSAALADRFTVHTIERRGRGTSGPQGDHYGIAAEVADIAAVQAATEARLIFGHSFAGFVALEAATRGVVFDRIAVYEPGVSIDGSVPMDWAAACQRQIDDGRHAEAFLTFIRGINPETTGKAPLWLLRIIIPIAIRKAERLQKYELLSGTIREHAEAAEMDNDYRKYADLTAGVLLMAGKGIHNTGAGRTTVRLAEVVTDATLVTFPKLDHFGYEKDPKAIATVVANFFRPASR